jgi:hypothetical protein
LAVRASNAFVKILRLMAVLLVLGVLTYLGLPHLVCLDVPRQKKMADCTTNRLAFAISVEYRPPYALVLGLPKSNTNAVAFKGEVRIKERSGAVLRLPIGSDDMTACNWLDTHAGLDGYILTWRTNRSTPLSDFLHQGSTFQVEVTFTECPPETSSLWLSSMGQAKLW